MLGLALTFFTSAVQVFFKDMAQIVGICLQFGMWLTPIMYDEKILPTERSWLGTVFKLNPFITLRQATGDSMMTETGSLNALTMTLYFWAVTLTSVYADRA